jgi:hypothetical protein
LAPAGFVHEAAPGVVKVWTLTLTSDLTPSRRPFVTRIAAVAPAENAAAVVPSWPRTTVSVALLLAVTRTISTVPAPLSSVRRK